MIRDPMGGWDWDGIKQILFTLTITFCLVSFASSTGGYWYDPWVWMGDFIFLHSAVFLILSMIGLLGFYWHERFTDGLH